LSFFPEKKTKVNYIFQIRKAADCESFFFWQKGLYIKIYIHMAIDRQIDIQTDACI